MERIIRSTQAMIFAPSSGINSHDDIELVLDIYTPSERREYLFSMVIPAIHPTVRLMVVALIMY